MIQLHGGPHDGEVHDWTGPGDTICIRGEVAWNILGPLPRVPVHHYRRIREGHYGFAYTEGRIQLD